MTHRQFVPDELERWRGFASDTQLRARGENSILFAGAGSVGGWAAYVAAVDGHLADSVVYIADGDRFEASNQNRQFGAAPDVIGHNKAVVVADQIRRICPTAEVVVIDEYLTPESAAQIVTPELDLIVDATDYDQPQIGDFLNKLAREHNVLDTMFWEVGYSAMNTTFHPSGLSFEDWFSHFTEPIRQAGVERQHDLADPVVTACMALYPWLTYVPSYIHADVFTAIVATENPKKVPQIAGGVMIGNSLFSAELSALLDKPRSQLFVPTHAPSVNYVDTVDRRAGRVETMVDAADVFWDSVEKMLAQNRTGRIEPVWQ